MKLIRVSIYLLFHTRSLLAEHAASQSVPNPTISNGTCYFQAGQEADSTYIPCGNTAFGVFACCEGLSNCLGHSACFSGDGTTYVAGCTDPSYYDSVCPYKGSFGDQQWNGLVYCNGTSDEWTLCDDSAAKSPTVVGPAPACWCPTETSLRRVAFTAPGSLQPLVSLPLSTGSAMSFFDGYTPITVTTDATASTSSSPMSSSSATASSSSPGSMAISTSSPTSISQGPVTSPTQSASGLSSGAKVGVGVGAGIGGCVLMAVLCCIPVYIRRRNQRWSVPEDATIRPRSQALVMEKDPSDEVASPTWSGNKSELPADERNSASLMSPVSIQGAWTRPTSAEVEGSVPMYQSMRDIRSHAMGETGPVYKPYRRAEAPPNEAQEAAGEEDVAHVASRPGRAIGSGIYEMPAQVPGSTLQ